MNPTPTTISPFTRDDIAFVRTFLFTVCGTPSTGALASIARATPTSHSLELEGDAIELGGYTIQKKATTRRTIAGPIPGPTAYEVTTAQTVAARRDCPEDADLVDLGEGGTLAAALLLVLTTELEQFTDGMLATWGEQEAARTQRELSL